MEARLDQIPCGFISLNSNYIIEDVNETFLKWAHFARQEIIGKHIEQLLPTGNKLIFHSYFYPNMSMYAHVEELFIHIYNAEEEKIPYLVNANIYEQNGQRFTDLILVQMKKRIGYEREIRNAKLSLENAYKEKTQAYEHLQQIYNEIEEKQVQLMAINNELVKISNTDKLTGIANRRYFQIKLEAHIDRFKENGTPFSLLLVDIDYFKQVNDTYGHQVGDVVLKQLAIILKECVRPTDTVARFGGEEFTILLGETDELEAMELAHLYNEQIENSDWPTIGQLTISIGCATYTSDDNEDTLLQHADEALYQSKRNGRNQATLYSKLI